LGKATIWVENGLRRWRGARLWRKYGVRKGMYFGRKRI